MKIYRKLACCIILLLGEYGWAQTPISLQNSIDISLKTNGLIKNKALIAEALRANIATATELPKMQINSGLGQVNSKYFDSRFGASQSFPSRQLVNNLTDLNKQYFEAGVLDKSLSEHLIKKELFRIFYEYNYINAKKNLLEKTDTLVSNFYEKTKQRLREGEANILEKTTAENQKGNLDIQTHELNLIMSNLASNLNIILQTKENYIPQITKLPIICTLMGDSIILTNNLQLNQLQQQIKIAQAQTNVEKAKLLPDFFVGYINNSFIGIGPDNLEYKGRSRFHSAELGLSVPLFKKAQKAKILYTELQAKATQQEFESQQFKVQKNFEQLWNIYQAQLKNIRYFESKALANAQLIKKTAQIQFDSGEINYLDFVLLINSALDIENSYLDYLFKLNQSIIDINFFNFE